MASYCLIYLAKRDYHGGKFQRFWQWEAISKFIMYFFNEKQVYLAATYTKCDKKINLI